MAKANKQTQPTEEIRHNRRGELIFTTLTADNNFYSQNQNLLQLAQYLTSSGKNSVKMKNDNNIFSFTDYSIYNMDIVNEDGELIEQTLFVIAYDNTTNTCYYSMSKGLTAEFEKLAENKIIPSNGFCKWTARVVEKSFKTDTGAEKRTYNLEILGIENFNSDVVCNKKALIESAPETAEEKALMKPTPETDSVSNA